MDTKRYKQGFWVYKCRLMTSSPIRKLTNTRLSVMVKKSNRRKNALSAFVIPSVGQAIGVGDWASREPNEVWYGLPEEGLYSHPNGGKYKRCRIEAFTGERSLGYLPLPRRYAQAWVQLCYTVVYWRTQWKAWVDELARPPRSQEQPAQMVQDCVNNSGARFLQYLVIRRLIIDELLQHPMAKDGSDELEVFDEYLIRERFNWLWKDFRGIPASKRSSLRLDPVHPKNKGIFGAWQHPTGQAPTFALTVLDLDWSDPSLNVPPEMVVPKASPGQSWLRGVINHFDFQAMFEEDLANLVEFYKTRSRQRRLELPYNSSSVGLPDSWHEAHEPAVHFLTAEGDEVYG